MKAIGHSHAGRLVAESRQISAIDPIQTSFVSCYKHMRSLREKIKIKAKHSFSTMTASVYVPINPELLIWARESAGYDTLDAANRLNISQSKLESMEAGESQITYVQLRTAANLYKRSLAAFFMQAAPPRKELPCDFRMQHDFAHQPFSPALSYEIRKASKNREDAIDLAQQLGKTPAPFLARAAIEQSPDQVASQIRNILHISVHDQLSWRNQTDALKIWKASIEKLGVLVFEASRIPMEEMRGVSLWNETLPVILINGADSHNGRTFTLLHELTHLLLRQGGICDLAPTEIDSQNAKIEIFCNAVAGATLVPLDILQSLLGEDHSPEWSMEELAEISSHFKVSKEVILRRLLTLGKTTNTYYQQMRQVFNEEYRRIRAENRSNGGPSPSVMAVRNLGKPFVSLVLSAYHDNMIGLATVSDYLGLKIKHVPRVEMLLSRAGES